MSNFYNQASWVLVPSGIEEDIVFAQKPISGLGDLSFTRASDATYTDSTGVVRRSPYNLLTYSEMFSDASWTRTDVAISANTTTAPNGTLTADKITPNTTNTNHILSQAGFTFLSGIAYTFSYYAKSDGYTKTAIRIGGAGYATVPRAEINLATGAIIYQQGFTNLSVTSAENGFYRISGTFISGTGLVPNIQPLSDSYTVSLNNYVYAGDGTSGIIAWGAQLVEGSSALDYFPTTNRQDVPRIDFRNADGTLSSCGRLLLEPQRTNSIRNSSMVGAVAGTPGTNPTNWALNAAGGLSTSITGIGTENGLPYIDFRFNGTATGTFMRVIPDNFGFAATTGQVWSLSYYAKLIANSLPASSYQNFIFQSGTGGFISALSETVIFTNALRRYVYSPTLNGGATQNSILPFIQANLIIGQTYDFTIRIAAPQMELGAYATTWVPTTTAAVTRLADTASKTGVSSLIGQTEGTMFFDFVNRNFSAPALFAQFTISGGDATNRCRIFIESGFLQATIRVAGVEQVSFPVTAPTANAQFKVALAYKQNDFVMYINGTEIGTDTSGNVPSCSRIAFDNGGGLIGNDQYINQAALFPTRLTNAQLAQLTTL